MNPYPEYKDSGVAWLGQIPAHWRMQRTKYLFDERVEKGFPDEPLLAATQTQGVVPKTHYESRTVTAQKDLHLLKLVEPGDYVISLRSFQGGIEYAHYRGIISPAYTILQPSPRATVTRDYFEFFFKSQTFVNSLTLFVTGIREGQNIDYERLSRSPLPVPPADEQAAIGRFLRVALGKANRLIRTKRRLIELLQEQKQAIIHQAVTRGLDPDVRLKPSGVEWLGEIPEHWEVRRLKSLFREVNGRSDTGMETLLSLRMYQGLVPHNDVSNIPIPSASLIGYKRVKLNEIVMNRMRAAIGMFAVSPGKGIVSPDYAIFEAVTELQPDFFVNLFKTPQLRAVFRIESTGLGTGSSGFLRLYSNKFLPVAFSGLGTLNHLEPLEAAEEYPS